MIKKILKRTNLSFTPAIESTADKIVEALDVFVEESDTSAIAEIEIARTTNHHKSGEIYRAEINFHSRMGTFRVESEKEDPLVALNSVKEELVNVLRSKKTKRMHFIRKSGLKLKNMLKGLPWNKNE